MSRAVNAIVIGIVAFVLLAGSIWYVIVAREPNRIESSVENQWASDGQSITTHVTFENPYDYDVVLRSYDYAFLVNGREWSEGQATLDRNLPPKTDTAITLEIPIPPANLTAWFEDHVANEESSTIHLRGKAVFGVSDRNRSVDFGYRHTFKTHILSELEEANACARSGNVCYAGADAHWVRQANQVVLVLNAQFRNLATTRADLDDVHMRLRWGDVEVATAQTSGGTIAPRSDLRVQLLLSFNKDRILQWWTPHTQRCETSQARAEISINATQHDPDQPTQSETPSPSSTTAANTSSPSPSPTNTTSPSPTNTTSPTPTNETNSTEPGSRHVTRYWYARAEAGPGTVLELRPIRTAFACAP